MTTLPRFARCSGYLGCNALLDLGVAEAARGSELVEHLRQDPRHQETALPRLLQNLVLLAVA